MQNPIVLVVATRPDAIKLAPIYLQLKKANLPVVLCSTTQHRHLLQQVLELFNLSPDISLDIMKDNQSLAYITDSVLQKLSDLFKQITPQLVIVQGDTTSAYAAALAAFYQQLPIAHVEAGLRTGNLYAPFPEELNRVFITQISSLHFAPTPLPVLNLLHEGVTSNKIFCVGNTIVDALHLIRNGIETGRINITPSLLQLVKNCKSQYKRMVLLTTHRRESFGHGIKQTLSAIKKYATLHPEVCIVFPIHPNPQVGAVVQSLLLHNCKNIFCLDPLAYNDLVYILSAVDWVITDSGGIQEEASCLGKQVIVLREHTERVEIIWEGLATMVGTNYQAILDALETLHARHENVSSRFVYGDGKAAERIVAIIRKNLSQLKILPAQIPNQKQLRIPVAFPQQQSYPDNR
jgi:UDP-N-acetylglucosamine 2-epimerase (non-hydrolysing)